MHHEPNVVLREANNMLGGANNELGGTNNALGGLIEYSVSVKIRSVSLPIPTKRAYAKSLVAKNYHARIAASQARPQRFYAIPEILRGSIK